MTPSATALFLEALRRTGIKSKACLAAGVSYNAVARRYDTDDDFRAAYDDALDEATDAAEAEVRRRGIDGVDEPLVHQGGFTYLYDTTAEPDENGRHPPLLDEHGRHRIATRKVYSDAALLFLLKGRRKKVFAERTEVTGAEGGPVVLDEGARAARVAQLVALAKARAAAALAIDIDDLA